MHEVDGGLVSAPNDHVWSAFGAGKGGREVVGVFGEVHCDLLLWAGVATTELVQQFKNTVVALVEAPALQSHRAVVQGV